MNKQIHITKIHINYLSKIVKKRRDTFSKDTFRNTLFSSKAQETNAINLYYYQYCICVYIFLFVIVRAKPLYSTT